MSTPIVTSLFTYPIKGMGGISLKRSEVLKQGLLHDRQWMLVNNQGEFISQREYPILALMKCQLQEQQLVVRHNENEISLGLSENVEKIHRVKVWSSKLNAHEVNPNISNWFSTLLNEKVTLVKMTSVSNRPKRLYTSPYKTKLGFSDGYPILILSEESMSQLNEKLDTNLDIDRFRANIIVSGVEPHEEDNWKKEFTIGSTCLKVIKPCARCMVTTIDQQTGIKGKEPLATLATYRRWRKKIWFGANAITIDKGDINVGDKVILQ